MDRSHPVLAGTHPASQSLHDGTGHFQKEILPKPEPVRFVPRRFGRYGMPLHLVRRTLASEPRPDCILVTSGMTYWYPAVAEAVALVKSVFPGAPVLLGGIYATLCADHARITAGADRVIPGEGEPRILDAVAAVTGWKAAVSDIRDDGVFPAPAYELYNRLESAAVLTSRGCPFRCPFCASHLLSGPFRRRDPALVAVEIQSLCARRGVKHFAFLDDALLYRKEEHFLPLLDRIARLGLDALFHTPNGLHPAWMDSATAAAMRRAGFATVRLSFETADGERQMAMGSKVTNEALVAAVRWLSEAGFGPDQIGAYVIMGLPGQSLAEVADSLAFVFSLGIKISLALFSPIPGTPSYEEAVAAGLLPAGADPLLTNNSAFLMLSRPSEYRRFVRLGTIAANGNGMVKQGRRPMEDAEFRKALREMVA
jgi:radical SAM superfamily enzyme YgiQ (UPF0313 family)